MTGKGGISLRIKLIIALTAMALIPIFLSNLLTLRTAEQTIRQVVFERNRNMAENIAGDINQMFSEQIRMLKIAANNTDIRSMDAARMVPALSHIPANHPELLMAIVLAPNGDLLARSDGKSPANANYRDRKYFQIASRTGHVTISDVLVSKTTGKLDIGIAEPFKNPDQTLRGMVVIGVSLKKIIDRIAKTKVGTAGYAYVVNKKGKVLIHPDRNLEVNSTDFSDLPPVKDAIRGKTGWMEYEFHGREMLAGYSHVPITGWGLIVQQPLTDAMAAATKLRNTAILMIIVTTLFAVVVAFALAGVIFKPIALLTVAAGKVAEGDFAVQADYRSPDELGTLAAAFNNMAKQLRIREEDLRQSQEQYRRIVDTSAEGIVVLNKNELITFANVHMSEMLGYQREEMIGRELKSFVFDEDLPDHKKQMKNRQQGIVDQYERRWKHRDGHAVWTNISATPIFDAQHRFDGAFGMITDITKRKKTEDELKKNEAHYRSLFDNSLIGVSVTDKNLIITDANDAFCTILGYSREEVIGKISIVEVTHPDDLMGTMDIVNKLKRHDNDHFSFEKRYVSKTGKNIHVLNYIRGIYSLDGDYEGTTASILDITEHLKIEQQLQQAQKMESVGRLAGGVAHDFNNMLGVILGRAEMAMKEVNPTQPLYGDLEEIRKAATRSADLTRQLLAFARKQTVAPEILDLNEAIEGMLNMLRRLIGEHIDLIWMPATELWPVKIDPSQIDQILANLCVNARDAIDGVGKIIVETGNETLDSKYCSTHPEAIPGEYVRISVNDTGYGMDNLTITHIFEPFFTTKNIGAGTGLGLAMVYGAVKQNNGFINVSSEPRQGTIFTIYLPRHQDAVATGKVVKEGAVEPAIGGHETILVVEDEQSMLNMTTTMLQNLGYIVKAASTPGEAIHLVEDSGVDIHLLMTDVIMPEMNGRDLSDRLMAVKKGLKCLFMSGYPSEVIANQGMLVKGMHFIQKPFSQKELAVRIRELLDAGTEKGH